MKRIKFIVLAVFLLLSAFCSNQNGDRSKNPIDYNSLEVVRKEFTHFNELGNIYRAVKLETTKDALIGTINYVKIDEKTNDILVGDFRSAQKVFRFDKDGRFFTSYGRIGEGPGEHKRLKGFTPCPNGDLILLSNDKLIKYSREGTLLLEKKIDYIANDIMMIGDLIYISIFRFRMSPWGKNAIFVLNTDFKIVHQIGEYDLRLEKYSFITTKSLASKDNDLYFLDFYNLKFNIFKTNQKKIYNITVPNDNQKLDKIWSKKRLSEEDMNTIMEKLHRFDDVYSFNDGLIFMEICGEKKIFNLWLFEPSKKKAIIFPYHSLCRDSNIKFHPDLYFDWIAGSYDKGVICVLDTVDEFNAYKDNYPALKDLSLKIDENPILVFFEFDMNKIEKGESK